jgi:preprotein translocase subunit SecF
MKMNKAKIHNNQNEKGVGSNSVSSYDTTKGKKIKQNTQETFVDDFGQEGNGEENETKQGCCKKYFSSAGHSIVKDVKQTIGKHWVGEMLNFNQKTLAVSFFLFFAAIVSLYEYSI